MNTEEIRRWVIDEIVSDLEINEAVAAAECFLEVGIKPAIFIQKDGDIQMVAQPNRGQYSLSVRTVETDGVYRVHRIGPDKMSVATTCPYGHLAEIVAAVKWLKDATVGETLEKCAGLFQRLTDSPCNTATNGA